MKSLFSFLSINAFLTAFLFAQPDIQWQKALGGSSSETGYSAQQTSDSGYIIAGFALSNNNGDVWGGPGNGDFWIVKLTNQGVIEWQKALGGSSTEVATSIQQTFDGGYIVAGRTNSNDGDVTGNHGGLDCWVVRLSGNGDILWQKTLGGSSTDLAYSIQQTDDGGYIMAGTTFSNDGDVSTNHLYYDGWLVKLSETGAIQWQKSLGGENGSDKAYCVRQTKDGGYILVGETNSSDGELAANHGSNDFWVAKVTNTGHLEWQKAIGGAGIDAAYSICQTTDGQYVVAGTTGSYNSGQVNGSHGGFDIWVVKLNDTGNILWQKALGGSDEDYGSSIQQTIDGGYVVAGTTGSVNGDVSGNDGTQDFWVVKLNATGEIQRQRTLGGTNAEWANSICQTIDNGFLVAGYGYSNDGDVSGYHGDQDIWVVKLTDFTVGTENIPSRSDQVHLGVYPNPAHQSIFLNIPSTEQTLEVSISDIQGRKIIEQTVQNGEQVSITSLPNGLYLVMGRSSSGVVYSGTFQKE